MKGLSKEHINCTFGEILFCLGVQFKIPPCKLLLDIRFFGKQKEEIVIIICKNTKPITTIEVNDLLTRKMIGLRLSVPVLEKLFRTVHNAFVIETKVDNSGNQSRISLLFYQSAKAKCPCLGIIQDNKTLKVLRLHDITQAIELESEQLN